MKVLNWDNFSLIRVSEQLDPKGSYSLIRSKIDALDEAQYFRYINTCNLVKELSKRLNDLDGYFSEDLTKEQLENRMQTWTTDLYDKT